MRAQRNIGKHKGRRGQALVEFALALTVILVFLFGIIDWSIAYFEYKQLISNAARAARYASIYGDSNTAAIQNYVMCGAITCPDGASVLGLAAGNIAVSRVQFNDTGTFTDSSIVVPKWHLVIQITGWSYNMFTPYLGRILSAQPITIVHPMECQAANGDCSTVT